MTTMVPSKSETIEHTTIVFTVKTLLFNQPLDVCVCLVNVQIHTWLTSFHTPQIKSNLEEESTLLPTPLLKPLILLTKPLSKACIFFVGYFCYFKCTNHSFPFLNLISKKFNMK